MTLSSKDQLLGFIELTEEIIINEVLCISTRSFNFYEESENFLKSLSRPYSNHMDFIAWLIQCRFVVISDKKLTGVDKYRRYKNYPKTPRPSEIFNTVTILREMVEPERLDQFTPMDILILTVVVNRRIPWAISPSIDFIVSRQVVADEIKRIIRAYSADLRKFEADWRQNFLRESKLKH